MYIVNNETNLKKWEVNTLDDLMFELDVLNVKNKRKGIKEELVVYKINDEGEILDEIELTIPTEKDIDDIFESFLEKEGDKEVEELETSLKENIEELTEEEKAVLDKISVDPNPKANRDKIIEKLNQNHKQEQEEIEKQNEEEFEKQKKEQELLAREKELERRELELKQNMERQAKKEQQIELQAPVSNIQNQTTRVYEGISIKSTDELTDIFKNATISEVKKLDEQIYILNRQRDKYIKLIKVLDEVN